MDRFISCSISSLQLQSKGDNALGNIGLSIRSSVSLYVTTLTTEARSIISIDFVCVSLIRGLMQIIFGHFRHQSSPQKVKSSMDTANAEQKLYMC